MRQCGVATTQTWGCGYLAPNSRMQYTSSSFSQMLVRLFAGALRPIVRSTPAKGFFPTGASFFSHVADVVLEQAVLPVARRIAGWSNWIRRFQQGSVQAYLSYFLGILVVILIYHFWEFWSYTGWFRWGWSH